MGAKNFNLKVLILIQFLVGYNLMAGASNFYSWPSGSAPYNWNDSNNWSSNSSTRTVPSGWPNGPDDVEIRNGHTITMNVDMITVGNQAGLKSLTVNAGGILTYTGTGSLLVGANGPLTVSGSVTLYCIRLKQGATATINSGGQFSTTYCNTMESSTTLLANGTVSITGSFSNSGTVSGTGSFTIAAGTSVSGTGTVYGVTTSTITTTTTVTVGAYTWTGTSNTTWGTSTNWALNSAPNSSSHNVSILKSAGGSDPHIVSAGQACGKLYINSSNNLYVDDGNDITASDSVIIRSGSTNGRLYITPGGKFTANGKLINNCDTAGIIIQSNATKTGSLIHNSDNVKGTIKRYIPGSSVLTSNQYHLVSVPLTALSGNLFSSLFLGSYLFDYTESTAQWQPYGTPTTIPLTVNSGYMIFYPSTSTTYNFPGPLNNGTFSATVSYTTGKGYNLVPNPFPSAINWNAVSGWTKTNVDPIIWIYNSTSGNYGTWNGSSGTLGATQNIPVGQAFFIHANASSPVLTMANSVRVHAPQSFMKNSEFFSSSVRIKANGNGFWDEAVAVFNEGGTINYNNESDSRKFFGSENAPQLYLKSADNESISIKNLPYSQAQVVIPLAFELKISGQDTLFFEGIETFDPRVSIYLLDLKTGNNINLRQQPHYIFDHLETDDPVRANASK